MYIFVPTVAVQLAENKAVVETAMLLCSQV